MPIPFSYNVRNLTVRRVTTVMTALGTALSVAVLVSVLALVQGLRTSFDVAGNPTDVLVMRHGSTSELTSVITRQNFQDIKTMPGIAKNAAGQPLASLEMVTIINLASPGGEDMNVNVRGITPVGYGLRDQVHLAEGRWFHTGTREAVVGKSLAEKFSSARLGQQVRFGRANGVWTVVGIMDGGRSVFNGEIWVDLNQVSADDRREDFLSSVLLRAEPGEVQDLERRLEKDPRFNVIAQPEKQYYADQMKDAMPIQFMGMLVAIIMAVGSVFAAMNTMYAAVARRSAEIGTLRVLGFSKFSILFSFVLESVFLAVLGGLVGCVLAMPLNYISTDVGSFTTWSHFTFNFNVNPRVMVIGMIFALIIGAAGGFLPARNAARRQIIAALRAR